MRGSCRWTALRLMTETSGDRSHAPDYVFSSNFIIIFIFLQVHARTKTSNPSHFLAKPHRTKAALLLWESWYFILCKQRPSSLFFLPRPAPKPLTSVSIQAIGGDVSICMSRLMKVAQSVVFLLAIA
jgi:hypothetical protein